MTAIPIIPAAAALPVQMAEALTGEAPLWDGEAGVLWWIDIQGQRLLGFEPASGRTRTHRLPLMPGLVALRRRGGLVLGLEDGLYAFDRTGGLGRRLVAVEAGDPRTRLNDGKPDSGGRLWFGTMDKTGGGEPIGALYRLDAEGAPERMRTDVRIPNGICFPPAGDALYFADSRSRRLERIACDRATGRLGASTTVADYAEGEAPDGACVDAEGGIWIAVVGGGRIERRLPDGRLDLIVRLPVSRPTMPMLGGDDGRTLFVTSQRRFLSPDALAAEPLAGNLLAVRVPFRAGETHAAVIGASADLGGLSNAHRTNASSTRGER